MSRARLLIRRPVLAPVAWASLFALFSTQAALFFEATQHSHGFCAEHEGRVHHVEESVTKAPDELALVAPGTKKGALDQGHDHCEALGTGLRPAVKGPAKSCTPRFEKQPTYKPREVEARPVQNEPIYARAPKTSPPHA